MSENKIFQQVMSKLFSKHFVCSVPAKQTSPMHPSAGAVLFEAGWRSEVSQRCSLPETPAINYHCCSAVKSPNALLSQDDNGTDFV